MNLADLLELMHGAPDSFRTFHGFLRTWQDEELTGRAWTRYTDELVATGGVSVSGPGFSFSLGGGQDEDREDPVPYVPGEVEEMREIWIEQPDRARKELGDFPPLVVVQDALQVEPGLFAPLRALPFFDFEVTGRAVAAGRQGITARAVQRASLQPHFMLSMDPFGQDRGADELELVVDEERGVVLRREAFLEGTLFSVTELIEPEFDVALDPDVFVVDEPPPTPSRPRTIESVASRASFTVFVPAEIWSKAEMGASYGPEQLDPYMVEHAMVSYSEHTEGIADVPRHLTLFQRPASADVGDAWLDLDDLELDSDDVFSGQTALILIRDRTQIEVRATGIDSDELLELLQSLVPARTGPPPGFD